MKLCQCPKCGHEFEPQSVLRKDVRGYRKSGASISEIARVFGISASTASRYCKGMRKKVTVTFEEVDE